jgi:hypothetical protein
VNDNAGPARRSLRDRLDGALLTAMMVSLAFVLEKVLNRMVDGKRAPASGFGRGLFRRVVSEAAHLQHQRAPAPKQP